MEDAKITFESVIEKLRREIAKREETEKAKVEVMKSMVR